MDKHFTFADINIAFGISIDYTINHSNIQPIIFDVYKDSQFFDAEKCSDAFSFFSYSISNYGVVARDVYEYYANESDCIARLRELLLAKTPAFNIEGTRRYLKCIFLNRIITIYKPDTTTFGEINNDGFFDEDPPQED